MTVVLGIDEAGYGPLLGPLVVVAVALELPDPSVSPWELLADAVTPRPSARDERIPVADSKKVFAGRRGRSLATLERAVLGVLAAGHTCPRNVAALLAEHAEGISAEAVLDPWYRGWDLELPLACDVGSVTSAAETLQRALTDSGISVLSVACDVVLERRYNARVAELGTKSAVLFESAAGLLRRLRTPRVTRAVIDRHGGRARYLRPLRNEFPGSFVWVERENRIASSYRMVDDQGEMSLSFEVEADSNHFQVALASMVAKYVREVFMELLNRYWRARLPEVAPTAGYWADGSRFLSELESMAADLGSDQLPVRRLR